MAKLEIVTLSAEQAEALLPELAELLRACVRDGASLNFILPFRREDAAGFWQNKALPALRRDGRLLLAAFLREQLVGSVQLDCDTPPNQPHRAEICKLMVHPDNRRQGIAKALMRAAEEHALARGHCLLTLDTRSGDKAEPLYRALGYQIAGVIPGFALDVHGRQLDATTLMYKPLASQN
ncbi:GNAT family N-acetyltransferase [Chromobacterium sphagni]|uniref:GNAT family N-acetyltransferase n=1 Tax=Chromobacterium sphagni TaxID=1903179 RepID=A0A1S1X162_9NEIS|nr:GNAT family N-acetyltransferase [Chromobacterium sphagni]OHX13145.1 GNAT family N-acetyltransferase [Chromobacterium sphagni]